MVIDKNLCVACGKCVSECPRKAISKDEAGSYSVDAEICNDCEDMFDIECIRVCGKNAFAGCDGKVLDFDKTCRVRSEHLVWMMSIMGSKGNKVYDNHHWDLFRKIIASAYLDPELKVRLTVSIDDTCVKCHQKQNLKHLEESGNLDRLCFGRIGVQPGTIMRFWDAVKLAEEKYTIDFVKENKIIAGDHLNCFVEFVTRDINALKNGEL